MMSEKSRFLWSGQGRSPRRGNSQAEEDERNRYKKSEEKGIPGGGGTSCAKALGCERSWHVAELEGGQCDENGARLERGVGDRAGHSRPCSPWKRAWFCSECDGKHLQGLKWENEKIPQLPGTMGQQTSCCRHPDERCWTLISFSHS